MPERFFETGAVMTPTALPELTMDLAPAVGADDTPVESPPDQAQPHSAEWYDTPEFRRQLVLHFQKAAQQAVASNPPALPG
jgi:hypothetical protein